MELINAHLLYIPKDKPECFLFRNGKPDTKILVMGIIIQLSDGQEIELNDLIKKVEGK